jgi:hypothetical protein
MMTHQLINADCLEYLQESNDTWATIVADPPDNIGLRYNQYKDKLPDDDYIAQLDEWLSLFIKRASTVWFSFNARWTIPMGDIVSCIQNANPTLEVKPCVQTFTFGQHCHSDLGNNHRPLWRLQWPNASLFPDAIRVPSWRQENGDKRADPRGRVPGDVASFEQYEPAVLSLRIEDVIRIVQSKDTNAALTKRYGVSDAAIDCIRNGQLALSDLFDYPRVTGNSKQRRNWHPTQLNEGLVERCIKLTTPATSTVLDPFGGTGTTLRVCKRLGIPCSLIELDPSYCAKIAEEHCMVQTDAITWKLSHGEG